MKLLFLKMEIVKEIVEYMLKVAKINIKKLDIVHLYQEILAGGRIYSTKQSYYLLQKYEYLIFIDGDCTI